MSDAMSDAVVDYELASYYYYYYCHRVHYVTNV